MFLYKSSLLCCNKVLGHSHIQTANTHMDFGVLYLIWDKRDLALEEFNLAYYEYEHYFNNKLKLQIDRNESGCLVLIADAAMQIANIMDE
jgi:hypothetical protein